MNNFRIYLFTFIILLLLSIVNISHYVYHYFNHKYYNANLNKIEEKYRVIKEKVVKSKYFPFKRTKIYCDNIFTRVINKNPITINPIPPANLYNNLIQNGEIKIKLLYYIAQKKTGLYSLSSEWKISLVDEVLKKYKLQERNGGYSDYEQKLIDKAISKYSLIDKDIAIIGSKNHWVKSMIISKNPKSITTIPYLHSYIANKFSENLLKKDMKFDIVISSIEYSDYIRYGDIQASEEIWCMLKDGGYFLFALPYNLI